MPKCGKARNIQKLAILFIETPNESTFKNLVERINWGLRKYIFNIVGDNAAVDEIMSKTLETIYYKRDLFNPELANFSTWMYKIAYNNSLKYLQEKSKITNLTCSEDIGDIYESELYTDDDTRIDSGTAFEEGTDFIDITFTGMHTEVYTRERVLNEIYDASVESINYLPDNLKMVMHERLINNKKIEDIAIDNNVPVSSVKNWLRKGKVVLNETIKERYPALYDMYVFNIN
jgi:RNA polymerase sigma factor (sigma-70 family)